MMKSNRLLAQALFVFVLFGLSIAGQTGPSTATGGLTVGGEVAKPLKLTAADIAKMPHRSVQAKAHDGATHTYEGINLIDILSQAGVQFGEQLRGPKLSMFLVADAADGYHAVFALPELDPAFTDKVVILADKVDGKPLAATEGPLRIVVPDEKRQARWVRQVTGLTVMQAVSKK